MADADSLSLTRKSPASITKNACTECRRRKARCDGRDPCSRCMALEGMICYYAVSVRVSKESMRADIERLQTYRRMSEKVLGSLAFEQQSDFIIQCLREGQRVEDISTSLDVQVTAGELIPSDHAVWPLSPESSRKGSWSTVMSSSSEEGPQRMANGVKRCRHTGLVSRAENEDHCPRNAHQWTSVTTDHKVIDHLLLLYFCWEYPTFACLSKKHFLEDFRTGRPRYCSSLLVNAMLCLGCRFSDQLNTGLNSEQFYAEAERLWAVEQDNTSLTTIQAMNLMSNWEASCGRERRSCFYAKQSICMAVEMGLHVELDDIEISPAEHEVRSITFWGAFALDQVWSLSMRVIPCVSHNGVRIRPPDFMEIDEQSDWIPYTDDLLPIERNLHQPSNVRWVYKELCALSDVIHDSLYTLYTPERSLTSREILKVYTKYLYWYDSLPVALRRGENSTPAVLFVHMYYHFAILLLFGPFIKFRFVGSSIAPNEICVQAADAITSLVRSYRQLYSLRRIPCFVPYIVLASSIVHLVAIDSTSNTGAFTQILQCMTHLQEMSPSHRFASRAENILRIMAHNWSVEISQGSKTQLEIETKEAAALRPLSMNLFSLDMENLPLTRSHSTVISIFSPLPEQTPPLSAFKEQLQSDGFVLLEEG